MDKVGDHDDRRFERDDTGVRNGQVDRLLHIFALHHSRAVELFVVVLDNVLPVLAEETLHLVERHDGAHLVRRLVDDVQLDWYAFPCNRKASWMKLNEVE